MTRPLPRTRALNIVLTHGPGPDADFVEVETDDGRSVRVGQWITRPDGLVALRITAADLIETTPPGPSR